MNTRNRIAKDAEGVNKENISNDFGDNGAFEAKTRPKRVDDIELKRKYGNPYAEGSRGVYPSMKDTLSHGLLKSIWSSLT